MDTNFAATVIAVIEEGSIAGAARRLALTSGAIALRIKIVEAELGVVLFGRVGRLVVPTTAASRLLEPLRTLIVKTADLKKLAQSEQEIAGELRLGTIATAGTGILPGLLRRLTDRHPHLDIFIEPGTSLDLRERVLDGALDAAIMVEPPDPLRKAERFRRWTSEPLVMIAPPGTVQTDPLVLLNTETFVRYDRGSWGGRIVDAYLRRSGIVPRDRFELDALDGIVALVSAGLGIAIIPDWAGPYPQGTVVTRLPLPPPIPHRIVGLYSQSLSARHDLIALVTSTYQDIADRILASLP